jgi:hypothetical protein
MKYLSLFLLTIFLNQSCDNNTAVDVNNNCDFEVEIDANKYTNEISDEFTINDISLNEECLVINYSGSGCDGNSWNLQLIDSGEIAESEPLQRFLRIVMEDNEDCEAYLTKEISFDISSLKDGNEVYILNFQDYDQTILYE